MVLTEIMRVHSPGYRLPPIRHSNNYFLSKDSHCSTLVCSGSLTIDNVPSMPGIPENEVARLALHQLGFELCWPHLNHIITLWSIREGGCILLHFTQKSSDAPYLKRPIVDAPMKFFFSFTDSHFWDTPGTKKGFWFFSFLTKKLIKTFCK